MRGEGGVEGPQKVLEILMSFRSLRGARQAIVFRGSALLPPALLPPVRHEGPQAMYGGSGGGHVGWNVEGVVMEM